MKRNTRSVDTFFPFFGAGNAVYFERIYVVIQFIEAPSESKKKDLVQKAPKNLVPEWQGSFLVMENTPGKRVSLAVGKKVNSELDIWLQQIHSNYPLFAVYRPLDLEAGSVLSEWHNLSMAQAGDVLKILKADKKNKLSQMMVKVVVDFQKETSIQSDLKGLNKALDEGNVDQLLSWIKDSPEQILETMNQIIFFDFPSCVWSPAKIPQAKRDILEAVFKPRRKTLAKIAMPLLNAGANHPHTLRGVIYEAIDGDQPELLKIFLGTKLKKDDKENALQLTLTALVLSDDISSEVKERIYKLAQKDKTIAGIIVQGLISAYDSEGIKLSMDYGPIFKKIMPFVGQSKLKDILIRAASRIGSKKVQFKRYGKLMKDLNMTP